MMESVLHQTVSLRSRCLGFGSKLREGRGGSGGATVMVEMMTYDRHAVFLTASDWR
jgi:hypothetical protein